MMVKVSVIIVAGGSGARLGSMIPKQFLPLDARPILVRTIERFREALPDARIVVALPVQQMDYWSELSREYGVEHTHMVCEGGQSRFHSVRNALSHVGLCDYVAVHDGVRPIVSVALIRSALSTAMEFGSAIPVTVATDTLRRVDADGFSHVIDRSQIRAVQTPQIFETGLLREAYKADYCDSFTDDASVVEHSGARVKLCQGERTNIKITTAGDIAIAQVLIKCVDNSLK